ncbi:MAG TPA: transglycosylase domain-containing protein [Kofleriaceae bacterium]|nr:transglycosylase domain-containing protein [Kofleriaceae bacterium]
MAVVDRPRVVVENHSDASVLVWMAKLYAFAAAIGGVLVMLACVCVYDSVASTVPGTPDFRNYAAIAPAVSRVYAADGTLMGEFAKEWRNVTPYDEIPPKLVDAVLAIEDHDYWSHGGIYFKGIARAVWANLTAGDFAQGGSTITQQVAKQFLGPQKSIARKLKEAILARRLERQYSKKAILAVYLNHIYFGDRAFGVAAAAQRYFGKRLDQLTLAEMALIAGLPKAPTGYSPITHPDRAIARRNLVLDAMVKYGYATEAEAAAAKQEPLTLHPYKDIFPDVAPWYADRVRQYVLGKYGEDKMLTGGYRIETAEEPSFDAAAYENVDYGTHKQDKRQGWRGAEWYLDNDKARETFVARQKQLYGEGPLTPGRRYLALVDSVTSDGAKVIVGSRTLDLPLRNMSWAAPWSANADAENDQEVSSAKSVMKPGDVVWVQREIRSRGKFREWGLPDGHNPAWEASDDQHEWDAAHPDVVELDQVPHPQGALFTADHRNGYVTAMVGGYDYGRSVFNRAYQACRQPGSTYKPIYYSAALDAGYGYDSMFADRAVAQIDPVTGKSWRPSDYGGTDDIDVTLEYALVYSKNQPSIEIFEGVGAQKVKAWAQRLGFTSDIIADQALALGASCTYEPELARAFAIFAREGKFVDWVYVRRVVDRDGNVVEDNTVYYDPQLSAADRIDRLAKTAGVRPKQAISPRTAYLTSKLLRTVIQYGFSSVVRATDIPAAGKTGTSSATMDTHFVAYSSRFITAVWLGDDLRQRPLGKKDAAFMVVEPLWARFMYETTHGYPNQEIPWHVPDGVRAGDRGDQTKGRRGEPMDLIYKKPEKPDGEPLTPPDGAGGA